VHRGKNEAGYFINELWGKPCSAPMAKEVGAELFVIRATGYIHGIMEPEGQFYGIRNLHPGSGSIEFPEAVFQVGPIMVVPAGLTVVPGQVIVNRVHIHLHLRRQRAHPKRPKTVA